MIVPFSVGMVLNTMVLVIASKQSTRPEVRSRTNVHYLVFHLTIADTITSFITMPMETLWRLTIQVTLTKNRHIEYFPNHDAVVHWKPDVQGADDDQDWWLHPVLPLTCGHQH